MLTFFFWFDILAFTLLFSASGCTIFRQIKDPAIWQRNYLFYQLAWAFWLLLTSFAFFQQTFLPDSGTELGHVLAWLRIAFSFAILNLLPAIVYRTTGKRWRLAHVATASVLLLVLNVIYLTTHSLAAVIILNSAYHLFLAVITILGYRRYRAKKPFEKKLFFENFLLLTSLYFFVFTLLNLIFFFIPLTVERELSIASIGIFTFSWALVDILRFIQDWKQETDRNTPIPDSWGITPRESEIVDKILTGATNREISKELFISPRTVETHLYSIYRKCGVKNKIELLYKLKRS